MGNVLFTRRRKPTTGTSTPSPGPVPGPVVTPAPLDAACRAPFTTVYLDTNGNVRVCCWNEDYPLGNVATESLREIWWGERAEALRAAMRADDYGLGCEWCEREAVNGRAHLMQARQFDRTPLGDDGWPTRIEFSISNACNLQCVMCTGTLSSSIRAHREQLPPLPMMYGEAFFAELAEFLPHLEECAFVGGEPFVEPEAFRIWEMLLELERPPAVAITTNGTRLTPRVESILERLPASIVVSIDGFTQETYESIRIGADHAEVFANLRWFREYCERMGTGFSLAWCLMPGNWHELADFLLFADELDCNAGVNMVFTPYDFNLECMAVDDLHRVLATMEEQDATVASALVRNAGVWQAQLERVRRIVALRTAPPPPPEPPAEPAAPAFDPADVHLRIDVIGGRIVRVAADPTLAGLEADSWVGEPWNDPLALFSRSGHELAIATERRDGEVVEVASVRRDGFERRYRVHLLTAADRLPTDEAEGLPPAPDTRAGYGPTAEDPAPPGSPLAEPLPDSEPTGYVPRNEILGMVLIPE